MTIGLQDLAAGIGTVGTATPDDVLALRRAVWADGVISPEEAAVIFALNARLTEPLREWVDFFVEALSVWLVDEQEPRGYVDDLQARWVLAQIGEGGPVATPAELELLVRVMEKAVSTPEALRSFVLDQLEKSAISAGCVTANEVKLLRRVLFASGGDRPAGVSKREAEMLFRIKDACLTGDNAPEWKQLFVQGVANHLQGFGGFAPVSRTREADLDAFMTTPQPNVLGFFGRMMGVGVKKPLPNLRSEHLGDDPDMFHARSRDGTQFAHIDDELLGRDLQSAARAAAVVSPQESTWLSLEANRDSQIDEFEQALFDFLKQA